RAISGDHELGGRAYLREGLAPDRLLVQHGEGYLPQVAAGIAKAARDALDRIRGRRVRDEMAGGLGRDVPGRGGAEGAVAQRRLAPGDAAATVGAAEQDLVAGLVDLRKEAEGAGMPVAQRRHGPAGEDARERLDVGLGIATVDAERVQLQELAAEV